MSAQVMQWPLPLVMSPRYHRPVARCTRSFVQHPYDAQTAAPERVRPEVLDLKPEPLKRLRDAELVDWNCKENQRHAPRLLVVRDGSFHDFRHLSVTSFLLLPCIARVKNVRLWLRLEGSRHFAGRLQALPMEQRSIWPHQQPLKSYGSNLVWFGGCNYVFLKKIYGSCQ